MPKLSIDAILLIEFVKVRNIINLAIFIIKVMILNWS